MTEEKKLQATIGEFKGNPIISIPLGQSDKFPFSFGFTKAKAILTYLEDIQKFVAEVEAKKEPQEEQ